MQGIVKSLLRGSSPLIIPLEVEFRPEMNADLGGLARGAQVAIVLEDSEYDRKADLHSKTFRKSISR